MGVGLIIALLGVLVFGVAPTQQVSAAASPEVRSAPAQPATPVQPAPPAQIAPCDDPTDPACDPGNYEPDTPSAPAE